MSWMDKAEPAGPPPAGGGWMDKAEPADTGDYLGDVKKNAISEFKAIPAGLENTGRTLFKAGSFMNPVDVGRSIFQASRGVPFQQTPTGEDVGAVGDIAKGVGSGVVDIAKDVGRTAAFPFEMATGTPAANTMLGQRFRSAPIATIADIASVVPVAKGVSAMVRGVGERAFAGESANVLERVGARGVNNSLGISPGTVEDMSGAARNPGTVGVGLGSKLADEGLGGVGPTQAFDKAQALKRQYGADVGKAMADIKASNSSVGVYPELADPLKQEANPILKPILDQANKLRDTDYPQAKFEARYQRAMYNSLSNKANANDGFLTIDHINSEMDNIGNMLGTASEDHAKVLSKMYGKLADIRDNMVQNVADAAGSQTLRQNLLDANANYSRYARIMPDLKSAAAKEAVGRSTTLSGQPVRAFFKAAEPQIANAAYQTGRFARRLFTPAEDASTSLTGPISSLPEVTPGAKQGPPHALYAYSDEFGPNGASRGIYNVFGDPTHPSVQAAGWGSSVPKETIDRLKIPIRGREARRAARPSFR